MRHLFRACALAAFGAGPAAAGALDDCRDPGLPAAERLAACDSAVAAAIAPWQEAPALLARAQARRSLGEPDAAMVDAMAAERAQPDWAEPVFEQARVRAAQGRGEEAVALARRGIALAPGDVFVRLTGMEAMADAGAPEACLELAPEAERMAPEEGFVFAVRGRCRSDAGDLAGAAADFRRAIALGQDTAFNRNNLALSLLRDGRAEEAAVEARRALALDPGMGTALHHLAVAMLDAGDAEGAMAAWRKGWPAVATDRDYLGNGLAWRLYLAGRYAEGREVFEAAFGEDPWLDDANRVDTYAHLLAGLGMPDVATLHFLRAVELGGPDLEALYARKLTEFGFPPGRDLRAAILACARRVPACHLHD